VVVSVSFPEWKTSRGTIWYGPGDERRAGEWPPVRVTVPPLRPGQALMLAGQRDQEFMFDFKKLIPEEIWNDPANYKEYIVKISVSNSLPGDRIEFGLEKSSGSKKSIYFEKPIKLTISP